MDPKIRIDNESGRELWDVEIVWVHAGGWAPAENVVKQWPTLRPGEQRQISLPYTFRTTAFTAVFEGRRIMENLDGFYVGERETFVIRILPGGRVVRGHAHMVGRPAP